MKLRWLLHPLTVVFPTLGALQTFPLSNKSRAEVGTSPTTSRASSRDFPSIQFHSSCLSIEQESTPTKQLAVASCSGFPEISQESCLPLPYVCCHLLCALRARLPSRVARGARHSQQLLASRRINCCCRIALLTSSRSTEDDPPQEEREEGNPVLFDGLRSIRYW